MPEIDFIMSPRDEMAFVRFVLSQGAKLVPDVPSTRREYSEIEHESAYIEHREHTSLFYIVSSVYCESNLVMDELEKDGVKQYYIAQRNGGPTIDLLCSNVWVERGTKIIGMGSLGYYATFWSTRAEAMAPAPDAQKCFYRKLASHIRRHSTRIRASRRAFVLCQHAREELARGAQLPKGLDWASES